MKEIKIYVGLNDSETLAQRYDDEVYVSVLKKVCFSYHVPFSFSMSEGGYFHENGDYTQEHTLVLSLIDVEETTAEEIAKPLHLLPSGIGTADIGGSESRFHKRTALNGNRLWQ